MIMRIFVVILLSVMLFQLNELKASEDNHDAYNNISKKMVKQSIIETLDVLNDVYVYPEQAGAIQNEILKRMKQGKYDGIKTTKEFISIIGKELAAVSKDGHLGLMLVDDEGAKPTHVITETEDMFKNNYAFQKVEVLSGNIGYIKLNKFYQDDEARLTVDSAFGFLKNTDAMIIDLRDCIGGSPELVRYILSHFFAKETLLWRFHTRGNEVEFDHVSIEGVGLKKFKSNFPLYLLVGPETASAAELFSYTLKNHDKATIIGKKTMGIAHAVGAVKINKYFIGRFSMSRLSNPLTQRDWERVGVTPDVETKPEKSLEVAQAMAVSRLKSEE